MNKLIVRKAAVLGAGVMGAQIAAHLANANVPVVLFDLPAKEGDKNGVAKKALDGLKKLDPAPLASKDKLKYHRCRQLRRAPAAAGRVRSGHRSHRRAHGLEERSLREDRSRTSPPTPSSPPTPRACRSTPWPQGLPEAVRPRFCGIHFFNPPRYMHLVEIIATRSTDAAHARCPGNLADLAPRQGRHPRAGYAELRRQPHRRLFDSRRHAPHRSAFGLGFDEVDALTGPQHRPPEERHLSHRRRRRSRHRWPTSSRPCRTRCRTIRGTPTSQTPAWLAALIAKGALGQKTRCGIFRKQGKEIQVLDLAAQDYRDVGRRNRRGGRRHPEDQESGREVRRAARLGASAGAIPVGHLPRHLPLLPPCNSKTSPTTPATSISPCAGASAGAQGPFETWQAAGWADIAQAIAADIAAGKAMSNAPLPAWVLEAAVPVCIRAQGS